MENESGLRIELVGNPSSDEQPRPSDVPGSFNAMGVGHICWRVRGADVAQRQAMEGGAVALGQPYDYPPLELRLAFVRDPDGNVIEFSQSKPSK